MSTHTTQLPFSAKSTNYSTPPIKRPSAREREYLRPKEVEAMISAARAVGRHSVRDAAIILLMFRHGLSPSDTLRERTAELIALKWSQIDFSEGYIDIHRLKHGHDTVHPLRAPERESVAPTATELSRYSLCFCVRAQSSTINQSCSSHYCTSRRACWNY